MWITCVLQSVELLLNFFASRTNFYIKAFHSLPTSNLNNLQDFCGFMCVCVFFFWVFLTIQNKLFIPW
ncbi:hypothetical protein AQUCO_08800009v1 [Aquilegia coerulea]|uniref:Uncharacterized protein n=1 Tax=Aquilegia coerulea TaxID=218851 RepID=A0A2G5C691_AQUCA|nr:hypothetical protein AQUCO_08800009v1 [Aquilegia coerulea]